MAVFGGRGEGRHMEEKREDARATGRGRRRSTPEFLDVGFRASREPEFDHVIRSCVRFPSRVSLTGWPVPSRRAKRPAARRASCHEVAGLVSGGPPSVCACTLPRIASPHRHAPIHSRPSLPNPLPAIAHPSTSEST